jgi:DNA-binding response OmpR family regulator
VKHFCPNCGTNVMRDAPILLNDFSMMGESFPLMFRNIPIKLTFGESSICWSLMKAYPDPVKCSVLLDRVDSDGTPNVCQVLICRIRAKIAKNGAPNPIETVHRRGYRWRL